MKLKIRTLGLAVLLAAALFASAQDAQTDRVTVPLSNPGKPGTVSVELMFGSIKVVGYEGKDVIVEAKPRDRKVGDETPRPGGWAIARGARVATRTIEDVGKIPPAPAPGRVVSPAPPAPASTAAPVFAVAPDRTREKDKDREKSQKDKAAGMKRIPIENTGLTVEESDNLVTVRVESWKRSVDITLKVPFATSLKLQGTNLEDEGISVENVSGEIEVRGMMGNVLLTNVSGTVIANSTNGDVNVALAKVSPDKPMSFVTLNGDIDVTLPADTKATFSLKSGMGEVYSDFDMTLKQMPVKSEQSTKADKGKFRVSMDRAVTGTINGGGPEFKLQTYNGNIYIRKKK